ncbi:WD40-repeat-containing domain protein [Fimicolochytrium jonesii]|uniref:WD40-repeat-containing domain protein n=1 Tax=Fimicolochytrium jonesii TaxID=1396493 RepID=UPI0022FE83CB|nr:WD40-repeat-containing domain protein [Fimicolochytrium jonesii]KAI8819599.1 WD40-repeat-containing domain protein [Fimicolochytrium jonesii]
MDITVKPAAGAGTGAGVEKAKIESQGGAKTGLARYADDSDDDDDDDDDGAGSEDEAAHDADELPISHQAALKDHQRTVSALSIDPSGSRFVTGGRDCMFKLWDFHGMDASLKPFRSFEATSGNPIRDVQFSPSGDQILMASSSAQPKVYDRDGVEIVEFVKGDPYIRDMRHTKGHVAALTACRWHPFEKSTFLTASLDSTIRIWDVTSKRSHKQVIAVKSKQPGGKTAITAAAYSHDGKLIAGGGQDGALRIWNSNGNFLAPSHNVENAHMPGAPITSLTFSRNTPSPLLATRAMDDTLKLWDLRSLRQPLHTVPNLPNFFEETDVTFSPNDRYILTGTSVKKDQGFGTLCVFDRDSLKEVANVQVATSSVVRVAWHPKINQIVLGTGDGSVQVMYDPVLSLAGIKAALGKVPKKRGEFAVFADDAHRPIINPHALAMYRDDALNASRSTKRKIEKLRADPIATRKPDMPLMTGPGRGGKVGTNVTQHIMKGLIKDDSRSQDPREAFLKHAKEAEEKPFWVAPAYTKNQPKPVHAESVYEDEGEAARAAAKKRRQ